MKELLYKFLYDGSNTVTPQMIFISLAIAFVLAMILYFTYKFSFTGVSYNKKFNISLVMLTLITTMVMNIIGSSVALSLGMVGALSIVRFRTAIKDPRDTAYIFWAICIGLGMGTTNYYIVIIGTLCISLVAILLSVFMKNDETFLIIIRVDEKNSDKVRSKIFDIYKACKLRSETMGNNDIELVYQVKETKKATIEQYESIRKIKGVSYVNMVAKNGEILG